MIFSVSCHVSRVSNTWDQHCFCLPNLLQRIGLVLQTHGSNSSPRLSANSPKSGECLWWWRSECASICLSPTVEGAQTPHIGMTWMWDAVWKVLKPKLSRSGMVCTLALPRLLAYLSQIWGNVCGGDGVNVHPYVNTQQLKVLKHLI
jgi:hypothetical protein